MRPSEFAAYPYCVRVAATYITARITKIQLAQKNPLSRHDAPPCGELVVHSEGTYQIRSVPNHERGTFCLVVLNKHKPVARYEDNNYQRAAIDFITLVQTAEDERAALASQEAACV